MTDQEAARRRVGIALMCGTLAFFACLHASAKSLARLGVDPLLTTFMRYAVSVVAISLVINPVTSPGVMRTNRLWLQILRSLLLFGSTALNFLALRHLQLAETLSIQFAAPLAVALLAGPVLGNGPRPGGSSPSASASSASSSSSGPASGRCSRRCCSASATCCATPSTSSRRENSRPSIPQPPPWCIRGSPASP